MSEQFRYDTVLYPGYPRPATHPDRLGTMGRLFGIDTASIERSRTLEIGCGDGGNLIPIAYALPESRNVGIDLSEQAIEAGCQRIASLGIDNIELLRMDILDVDDTLGEFDYIIAHGVLSWVPPHVQDKILEICRTRLAPNGVAFVSYNTYPGWHMRDMVREMAIFHASRFDTPRDQVDQARAFLDFLSNAIPDSTDTYKAVVQEESRRIAGLRDPHFFHDDLSELNQPFYFYEFCERAAAFRLKYVGEAEFGEMRDDLFNEDVVKTLRELGSDHSLLKEQYMDFLKGRRFRQTLLCHADTAIDRSLGPERLADFHVASSVKASESDERGAVRFETARGMTFTMNHPLAIDALTYLSEIWPRPIAFADLLRTLRPDASHTMNASPPNEAYILGDILLSTFAENIVELHRHSPRFKLQLDERPVASRLARLQAETTGAVTNLFHQQIDLGNTLSRQVLMLADGTRDRQQIARELERRIASGEINIDADSPAPPEDLSEIVLADLHRLLRYGLFE